MESKLKQDYPKLEIVEDARDGESLSIRFLIPITPHPPEKIVLNQDNREYIFNKLELEPETYTYPDKLHEIIEKYLDKLQDSKAPFDSVSTGLILEAMTSLENKIYEGTVVLCRSAIDSSLYLACIYRKDTSKNGKTTLVQDIPNMFRNKNNALKDVNWDTLKQEAKKRFPKISSKIDDINKHVRRLGNFAAHLGESRIREHEEWFKKNKDIIRKILEKGMKKGDINPSSTKGYKLWTSYNEAEYALEETINFLTDLVDNY